MRIEDKFDIAAPIDHVYKEINDIGDIGLCIAGVKSIQVVNDDQSIWTVEVRAGFMARTFNIHGRITERQPPHLLAFDGTTQDAGVNGSVTLESVEEALTRCTVALEIEVTGAFRTIVDQMARGPQQKMVRQTIDNLKARLDGKGAVAVPEQDPDGRPGLLWRIRAWWRRRRTASV